MTDEKSSIERIELSDRIKDLCETYHLPDSPGGFVLAVIKDGTVLYKGAYGEANHEHKIPFSSSTVSDYASVAKMFTGFAIATLVQENSLGLDDDIHKYLPEVPDFGEMITIRHLLYHTSGIRDWVGLVQLSGRHEGDMITDDFLMKLVINQKELNFKPGESFVYSNTGYFLLAKIVACVTGKTFAQWTHDNIFKPLGMKNTCFSEDSRDIIFNRASSYMLNEKGQYVNQANQLVSYGSSSLFSTLDDMIKWMVNVESKELGGKKIWEMMCQPGILNNGEEFDYGFGISIDRSFGLNSIGHGGSWAGYLCQVSHYYEHNVSYILHINRSPSGFNSGEKFLNLILGIEDEKIEIPKDDKQPLEVDVEPDQLEDYVGIYKNLNRVMWVKKNGSQLNLMSSIGARISLKPFGNDLFGGRNSGAQFLFGRNNNGSIGQFVYKLADFTSEPLEKQKVDESGLHEYCGDYYCPELKTSYALVIKDCQLVLEHLHNEDVLLYLVDTDAFLGNKWWCTNIRIDRDSEGQINGFKLNCDDNNIQNLTFIRNEGE